MQSDLMSKLLGFGGDNLAEGGYSPLISGVPGQNTSVQSFSDNMGINPNASQLGGVNFMPNAVDSGSLLGGIFNDDGLLSQSNLSMGSDLLGIGTGLMGMYNSMQDRSMMEDMIDYGKDTANRNLANQALLTNQQLRDRANAKNAWNARTGRAPIQYKEVDGSPIK